MKIIFILIFLLLSFGNVFAADTPNDPLYAEYTDNANAFCSNISQPWSDWKKNNLLKIDRINYLSINTNCYEDPKKKDCFKYYKNYLDGIKADSSKILTIGSDTNPEFLEAASYVYKETMNNIYVCAVINTKIRIIDNLLKKIPTTQSNTKKKYEQQLQILKKKDCRGIQDMSELSLRKAILDNTTYQYCNYRYYLYYLDQASRESIRSYYNALDGEKGDNLEYMTQLINKTSAKITNEIDHIKEIFPQAMFAFSEFEKTYASHVVLEFILQDYIDLRVSLKKLLNPIGQVIYKASNAQAPMH